MASPPPVPFFDGHNDVLLRLYRRGGTDAPQAFLEGETKGHLDLLKALQGGFAGGLFAVFVPSPGKAGRPTGDAPSPDAVVDAPTAPPIDLGTAQSVVFSMFSLLFRIERESQGRVRVCRSVSDIRRCMKDGVLAAVLHIEGAEAIDLNFELLDVLYAAGLRSLGPVWSRPNAFGHGVPFLCPSSPDTGPGLTDLGKKLVRTCNRLRILIDLSHLNERGFWDVAAISNAPLVATHSNALDWFDFANVGPGRLLERAHAFRHHLLADPIAGNDGNAVGFLHVGAPRGRRRGILNVKLNSQEIFLYP
jgi:membrane dipeptidase